MGIYTAQWAEQRKTAKKNIVKFLILFVVALPIAVLASYLAERFSLQPAIVFLLAPLLAWLIAFTVLVVKSSRMICPRCSTRYSRGKYLSNCPKCDLRMFQEDP
jgi:MFS-type transporter involved in bile tolerance (Atg22 family)